MAKNVEAGVPTLDTQLCFALYAATRVMNRAYRDKLTELGLTYPQFLVMLTLWERDGQTVSEIGNLLMLDSGTLTPLIKRLEQMGFLKRVRRESDQREVQVDLTVKGSDLRMQAPAVREDMLCKLKMSEEDVQRIRDDIMGVVNVLLESDAEAAKTKLLNY